MIQNPENNNLYSKTLFINPSIEYILDGRIREYDISKANINILYYKGILNRKKYEEMLTYDRMKRQVTVGLMQRDNPEVAKQLKEGIIEAKELFFRYNDIQEYEVLNIRNDAIFLINKIPTITKFGNIEFLNKNSYSSYYRLYNSIEIFFDYDIITKKTIFDVKGMSDSKLELHDGFFKEFLEVLFYTSLNCDVLATIKLLKSFYYDYTQMVLPEFFYRTFNNKSIFIIGGNEYKYLIGDCKSMLDITHNLNILIQLYKIYTTEYFKQNIV